MQRRGEDNTYTHTYSGSRARSTLNSQQSCEVGVWQFPRTASYLHVHMQARSMHGHVHVLLLCLCVASGAVLATASLPLCGLPPWCWGAVRHTPMSHGGQHPAHPNGCTDTCVPVQACGCFSGN